MRDADSTGQPSQDLVAGIYVEHLERLFGLLTDHLPKVLESNRFFEEETGFHNEAGANNLVDALSHIGTLAENASNLGRDEQRDEITNFSDHLRRSMMEGFERTLKHRIGEIADSWAEYERDVRPLQERGDVRGVPTPEELATLRRRIRSQVEQGRACKRAASWDEWKQGAAHFAEACKLASELGSKLEQSIGGAQQYDRDRQSTRRNWISVAIGTAIGIAGIVLGFVA